MLTSPRARLHPAILALCACAALVGCTKWRALRTRDSDLLETFVTERMDGTRALVMIEVVEVPVGHVDWAPYYRLRSIDEQGHQLARVLGNFSHGVGIYDACGPGRAGRFWCVRKFGHEIVQRDVDTLRIVTDFASLQSDTALADGVSEALANYETGELRVTTGRGDYVLLRGGSPEIVSDDGTSGGFIEMRQRQRALEEDRLVDHLSRERIEHAGTSVAVAKRGGYLVLEGVGPDGTVRWEIREPPNADVFNAYQRGEHAIVVVLGPRTLYALSFSLATGDIDWRYTL